MNGVQKTPAMPDGLHPELAQIALGQRHQDAQVDGVCCEVVRVLMQVQRPQQACNRRVGTRLSRCLRARREFLQGLMEASVEQGLSVMLSSHLVADLERVCDYLVVLVEGRVLLTGEVDELLETHHRLTGPRRDPDRMPADQQVVNASHTDVQSTFVVRTAGPIHDPTWSVSSLTLEDLVLAYISPYPQAAGRPVEVAR